MKIAAFNVENLFDRAKAFNSEDPTDHQQVLDDHAELNKLFELEVYTPAVKARMLELIERLGMLHRDEGRGDTFTRIRKIRGQLIRRPRDATEPREIVADGRDDWVGWVELKTETVDETAMLLTAKVIAEVGADILAVIEAESRPVLKAFQTFSTRRLSASITTGCRRPLGDHLGGQAWRPSPVLVRPSRPRPGRPPRFPAVPVIARAAGVAPDLCGCG